LIDPGTGNLLAVAQQPGLRPLRFDADGALLTCGPQGIQRWPRVQDPSGAELRFGPPVRLSAQGARWGIAASADGGVMAIAAMKRGFLLVRAGQADRTVDAGLTQVRYCAVSPDGRWVAVGNHHVSDRGFNAKVHDARTGRLVKELPTEGQCQV